MSALLFGLWSVELARPVHLVFEYDRLRFVHAAEVPPALLEKAPPELRRLPWSGPTYLSLRPLMVNEQFEMTMGALCGLALAARPDLWRPYETKRDAILKATSPVTELLTRFPARTAEIGRAIETMGHNSSSVSYLPVAGRKDQFWTAILDPDTGKPVGWMQLDSF